MFCKKCGAAVVGKFCSCCGTRIHTSVEEFRLAERRVARAFREDCYRSMGGARTDLLHLANACWEASNARYNRFWGGRLNINDSLPSDAYEVLEEVKRHAMGLFLQLINF